MFFDKYLAEREGAAFGKLRAQNQRFIFLNLDRSPSGHLFRNSQITLTLMTSNLQYFLSL
jgi:hypothetical protein